MCVLCQDIIVTAPFQCCLTATIWSKGFVSCMCFDRRLPHSCKSRTHPIRDRTRDIARLWKCNRPHNCLSQMGTQWLLGTGQWQKQMSRLSSSYFNRGLFCEPFVRMNQLQKDKRGTNWSDLQCCNAKNGLSVRDDFIHRMMTEVKISADG